MWIQIWTWKRSQATKKPAEWSGGEEEGQAKVHRILHGGGSKIGEKIIYGDCEPPELLSMLSNRVVDVPFVSFLSDYRPYEYIEVLKTRII